MGLEFHGAGDDLVFQHLDWPLGEVSVGGLVRGGGRGGECGGGWVTLLSRHSGNWRESGRRRGMGGVGGMGRGSASADESAVAVHRQLSVSVCRQPALVLGSAQQTGNNICPCLQKNDRRGSDVPIAA